MTQETHGFLELVRLVRANLMHRKDVTTARENRRRRPHSTSPIRLCWSYT